MLTGGLLPLGSRMLVPVSELSRYADSNSRSADVRQEGSDPSNEVHIGRGFIKWLVRSAIVANVENKPEYHNLHFPSDDPMPIEVYHSPEDDRQTLRIHVKMYSKFHYWPDPKIEIDCVVRPGLIPGGGMGLKADKVHVKVIGNPYAGYLTLGVQSYFARQAEAAANESLEQVEIPLGELPSRPDIYVNDDGSILMRKPRPKIAES